MAISAERGMLIFRKMDRDLRRIFSDQQPEAVHSFRTTTRRLETLLEKLNPERDRNQKKLLKMLGRIRKRAGKVRDLDVQIAALRSVKIAQEPRRKTQLMQKLIELRAQHERKLAKLLKKSDIRELKRRLKRASQAIDWERGGDPLALARATASSVSASPGPATDELLHRYRIAVKRARYAAEFAPKSAEAVQLMAELKRLQDVLGNWHDWLTLTQTAGDYLGEVGQSPLVAALHNVTRGKFRHAVTVIGASRKAGTVEIPALRSPATEPMPDSKSSPSGALSQAAA
jgi:CHAD domain-containing protein